MSLRAALLVLAVVPGLALAALWGVTSGQTLLDFQRQAAQGLLAQKAGQPSNIVYYNLQEERRLSAEALATHAGATDALVKQRKSTDDAIRTFQSLSGVAADGAPAEVRDAVGQARQAMNQLSAQRLLVDQGGNDQQAVVYRYYTNLIAVDIKLFTALSHVDNGKVTTVSQPLVDLFWAKEMISRSDALLARGWPTGKLSVKDYQLLVQAVSDQSFQYTTKVAPYLPADEAAMARELVESPAWQAKTEVERNLLRPSAPDAAGFVAIGSDQQKWRQAMDQLTPRLVDLLEHRTAAVVEVGKGAVMSLLVRVVLTTVIGLVAVVAVILTSWRLTRTLRRRIGELQVQAEELERKLPEVVERLGQGEQIDVEAEAGSIRQDTRSGADDELAQLGEALNLARASALTAAVRQAEQHRGFERLLQRIARRTQLLIGQQLKKLDELERKHEDPEVLDGLFDLDHLTARLRRYEENLVILAGGTPHRRWRKPVPLLDVMRAAQGEVQDYRRVMLDLDGSPWLSERAVGPVAHILAELIENALSFSKPPSPVEVRAARVARGTAIEIEDRGLGMGDEQLAEANELMSRPPRTDVLARADDIRLGFFVIARLAAQHGLRVEFRPSAFGGTRAVVFIPDELITSEGPPRPAAVPPVQGGLPTRSRGRALAGVTAPTGPAGPGEPGRPVGPVVPVAPVGPMTGEGHGSYGAYEESEPHEPVPDAQPVPWPVTQEAPVARRPSVEVRERPAGPESTVAVGTVDERPWSEDTLVLPGRSAPAPEAPLPRRVRQASLVDELRVHPVRPAAAPKPPRWDENPLFRPAPRRAGAAIGAFQRRSRAARESVGQPVQQEPGLPSQEYRPESGGPLPADAWKTPPIPTTEDRS
ncbi:sensor histidine kinase [Saccharothrix sp. ST-888]|uniref:sensor histidine kinase n=1 Tax=Saccharothrix sp. ST-888 TaxID=1427391 RepID=UPI0007C7E3B5|nr:nitrate- and nitrite sensing domain-containing protein [Saccharothrix sp. ST-888]